MKNMKWIIGASVVVLLGLFSAGAFYYKKVQHEEAQQVAKENYNSLIRPHSPIIGKREAKVTLVEFLDPECSTCREFFPYMKKFLKDYKDHLRLVVRYAPFHANSKFVIRVLEAARKQNKYWETLEVLFYYQPKWGSHHHPRPELIWEFLPKVGLDIEQLKKDMDDPAIAKMIDQDMKDVESLVIAHTPTFFINGHRPEDIHPDELVKLIEQAIAQE